MSHLLATPYFGPGIPGGTVAAGQSLNAADNRQAYGFIPKSARTLNKARIFLSTVTGSPIASDIQLGLYSDSSGVPGSLIESQPCTAVPVVNTWNEWAGFTTALTAYSQYWLALLE